MQGKSNNINIARLQSRVWEQIHELKHTDPLSFHKHWQPLEDILSAIFHSTNNGEEVSDSEANELITSADNNVTVVKQIATRLKNTREVKKQRRLRRKNKVAALREQEGKTHSLPK